MKRIYETQTKRVKKNVVDETTKNEKRNKNQKREKENRERESRERKKRDREKREQKHHENVFNENIRIKISTTSRNQQSTKKIVIFTFDKLVRNELNERSNEQLNQRLKNHEKNFMMLNNNINDNDYNTKSFDDEHIENMNM